MIARILNYIFGILYLTAAGFWLAQGLKEGAQSLPTLWIAGVVLLVLLCMAAAHIVLSSRSLVNSHIILLVSTIIDVVLYALVANIAFTCRGEDCMGGVVPSLLAGSLLLLNVVLTYIALANSKRKVEIV